MCGEGLLVFYERRAFQCACCSDLMDNAVYLLLKDEAEVFL